MSDKTKKVGILTMLAMIATVSMAVCFTRVIPVNCALCKDRIYTLSLFEYHSGPWKEIPSIHLYCFEQIATIYGPNTDMTVGEWLEIRGWEPRSEEQKKAFEKLIEDFINEEEQI
jgi:hypothetical protein